MRHSWAQTWREVAEAVSRRAACTERQVGAVVVASNNAQHWVGYNGPPARLTESMEARWGLGATRDCSSYCPQSVSSLRPLDEAPSLPWPGCVSVHAEVNALVKSDPVARVGGWVYVTAAPCWKCALAVANSGVAGLSCPPWEEDREELGHAVRTMFNMLGLAVDDREWE